MKSYEMVETLSTKAGVSLELAKDALEKTNWDILDAAVYLERLKAGAHAGTGSGQAPSQSSAFFVSGRLNENSGSYATPGSGTNPGAFSRPYGYNETYTPPYKDFPNHGVGGYSQNDTGSSYFDDKPIGQAVGVLAGFLENIVNALFCCYFVVTRRDREIFRLHLLPTLMIGITFGAIVIPLILLGIAFECKYSIGVKKSNEKTLTDMIDDTVNSAWQTAQQAKNTFVNETKTAAHIYENAKNEFKEDYNKGKASVNLKKDI